MDTRPWTIPVVAAVSTSPGVDAVTVGRALAAAIENAEGEPRLGATCYLLPASAHHRRPVPPAPDLELYAIAIHVLVADEPDGRAFDRHVTRAREAAGDVDGVTGVAVLPLGREDFIKAAGNATLVTVSPVAEVAWRDPEPDR